LYYVGKGVSVGMSFTVAPKAPGAPFGQSLIGGSAAWLTAMPVNRRLQRE
jgi:hypothetical protein